jgi:hypothetical protein
MDFVTEDLCPPCASEAVADQDVWACGTQPPTAFWLPGCPNARFEWRTPGVYEAFNNGTARLTGEIQQVDDHDNRFCVDLTFSGRESLAKNSGVFPPPMSPKLDCVRSSALKENGGTFDTTEWHYYTAIAGTLTGKEDFSGTNFDVVLRGPAAQVGFGGGLRNGLYGLSAWLDLTRTSGWKCSSTIHGDVNINIDECR